MILCTAGVLVAAKAFTSRIAIVLGTQQLRRLEKRFLHGRRRAMMKTPDLLDSIIASGYRCSCTRHGDHAQLITASVEMRLPMLYTRH